MGTLHWPFYQAGTEKEAAKSYNKAQLEEDALYGVFFVAVWGGMVMIAGGPAYTHVPVVIDALEALKS
ncbi:MAG: hypothetical protein JXN61_12760 [Sedimentisphaerales bacterium]|nr:hypothetical protein [Sedimentisphaerales bacterium]